MELPGACRACGMTNDTSLSLICYLKPSTKQVFQQFVLETPNDNRFSQYLCSECITFLDLCVDFQTMCAVQYTKFLDQEKKVRNESPSNIEEEEPSTQYEDNQECLEDSGIIITCVDCGKTYINLNDYNEHSDKCLPKPTTPTTSFQLETSENIETSAQHSSNLLEEDIQYREVFMIDDAQKLKPPPYKKARTETPPSQPLLMNQPQRTTFLKNPQLAFKKWQIVEKTPPKKLAYKVLVELKKDAKALRKKMQLTKVTLKSNEKLLIQKLLKPKKVTVTESPENSENGSKKSRKAVHVYKKDPEDEFLTEQKKCELSNSGALAIEINNTPTKHKLKVPLKLDPVDIRCEHCWESFTSTSNLLDHMKIHKGVFNCRKHCAAYWTTGTRENHECVTSDPISIGSSDDEPNDGYLCSVCNEIFPSEKLKDEHELENHGFGNGFGNGFGGQPKEVELMNKLLNPNSSIKDDQNIEIIKPKASQMNSIIEPRPSTSGIVISNVASGKSVAQLGYDCLFCAYSFVSLSALKIHQDRKHPKSVQESKKINPAHFYRLT